MFVTKTSVKPMKMSEMRKKAEALGITTGEMGKAEIIHAIQQAEGYSPCFGKSNGQCSHTDCCFISDCFKTRL